MGEQKQQMNLNIVRAVLQRQSHPGTGTQTDALGTQESPKLASFQPLPWWQITRDALSIFLVTRLAYAVATYFIVTFSINSVRRQYVSASLSDMLIAWRTGDVNNYLTISAQGYTHDYLTAFFPLYPLLIHVFALGHSGAFELVVAMLISNLGTLAAIIGLGLLAAHEYGPSASVPTIRALIVFPLAFFLVMGYADNLFLALVIFAFFFARRGVWGGAIACTFVSALLRPTGFTLALPLLWEYGRQQGWWLALWLAIRRRQFPQPMFRHGTDHGSLRQRITYPLFVLAAAPAGIALFAGYCWSAFGDPLVFLHVQASHFYRTPMPLPSTLLYMADTLRAWPVLSFFEARNLIDLAPLIVFLVLVGIACMLRQMLVTYLLYMLGVFYADLAAPLVGPGLHVPFPSVGRHMLLAIPMFLLLGKWSTRRPWLDTLLLCLGLLLQGAFLVAVMRGNLAGYNALD